MHFHHRHDISGCTDDHHDWPDWAVTILATLDRMELQIMTAVQADLDAATTVITSLVAKVGDLEAQIASASPALDSTALNAEVASAQAVLNPAPAAPVVEPTPAPAPEQPASDVPAQPAEVTTPAADGTVPVQSVPSVPLA